MKRQHYYENELSEFRITAQKRNKQYEFRIEKPCDWNRQKVKSYCRNFGYKNISVTKIY